MPIEKELKYLLSAVEYKKLLRFFKRKVLRVERQTNYYFDSDSLDLRRKGIGLRLRKVNNHRAILSLKYPKKSKTQLAAYKERYEVETVLTYPRANSILKGKQAITKINALPVRTLKKMISNGTAADIHKLGRLQNRRTFIRLNGGLVMELDQYDLFGKRYYELELETERPKKADRLIRHYLKKNDIPARPCKKSKLARFIKAWKNQH